MQQQMINVFLSESSRHLQWLDLSYCSGFTTFPMSTCLPKLETLILNHTEIKNETLQAVAQSAFQLKKLWIKSCPEITDEGLIPLAQVTTLVFVDASCDKITDESVRVLEANGSLTLSLILDSCRSVSRDLRLRYSKRKNVTN